MPTNYTVSLSRVMKELALSDLYMPEDPEKIMICSMDVNRPGLELNRFYDYYDTTRILIFGNAETAFLNSLLKLRTDLHAGAVQNMKFSRTMVRRNFTQWRQLLESYFARGGAQAMITVVNRGDLESAMKEPEKWGGLMVRVGGFSARFVELSREIQMPIRRRTLDE